MLISKKNIKQSRMSNLDKFQKSLIEFKCIPSYILDMLLTDDKFWDERIANHQYTSNVNDQKNKKE